MLKEIHKKGSIIGMLLLVAVLACTVMTPVNAATNKSKSVEESF